MTDPARPRVAFLGTGVMGAPMARNLARAGFAVQAWNRTASKAQALEAHGVRPAAGGPATAAAGAGVLVTMLADARAVETAVTGQDGAFQQLPSSAVWVQMSTVGAPGAERLQRLAADHGVTYVDAPVLGSRQPAEAGELVILASGPEYVRARCAPVLDALGRRVLWIGAANAGSRLKVVVNAWLMATTAALAETLALAEGLGVDADDFLDVTDQGAVGALYTRLNGHAMAARDFPTNFPLALAAKDAGLALEAAGEAASALRVLEATHAQFARAVAQGHGDRDWAALIESVAQ